MSVTPSTSPASSSEKGSGTAMDWSMFSTPSRVLSPVLGGVTDTSTGRLGFESPNSIFLGFSFMVFFFLYCICAVSSVLP